MENIRLFGRNTREQNVKVQESALWTNREIKDLRESVKRKYGFDFGIAEQAEKHLPVNSPSFSWNSVAQKLGTSLREADNASGFAQVLRAGVQLQVNSMYATVPTTHEEWVHVVQSNKDTELYAPLQGISFLSEVGRQEIFPESKAMGLDIKLKNRKFGQVYPVERELLEDDQTGQFSKLPGLMAQYAKIALEVYCMGKLASVSGAAYSTLSIPISETKPSTEATYPWSQTLVGGGANRPASFTVITQAGVQAGFVGLRNQKNLLGLKMMVDPDRILVGPNSEFDAKVLLHSGYYPSVPSATVGAVGTNFAYNPVQGIANLTVSRFMFKNDGTVSGDSKAWYLMDSKVPWFILQLRNPAEVLQEAPNAGDSFNRDIIRYRLEVRMNADHIDPRFAWQGNDGSVTS